MGRGWGECRRQDPSGKFRMQNEDLTLQKETKLTKGTPAKGEEQKGSRPAIEEEEDHLAVGQILLPPEPQKGSLPVNMCTSPVKSR
jgi:hypothetical protein